MSITFHIPGALREFTAGRSTVVIEHSAATVAEALLALWTLYPGVRDRIATEQGQVREHINIFVGNEDVRYTGGLASRLSAGCEISIVPAVSGGLGDPDQKLHNRFLEPTAGKAFASKIEHLNPWKDLSWAHLK